MEAAEQTSTNLVSFPVVIHQTNNSYYIKIGNDKSKPEDFSIIIEDGKLTIAPNEADNRKKERVARHFMHTVSGKTVQPPQIEKTVKSSFKETLLNTANSIKGIFLSF